MVIPYLNGADLPIDAMTPTEQENYIENWCKTNWTKDEVVSISPLLDGRMLFGVKYTLDDWRKYYENI